MQIEPIGLTDPRLAGLYVITGEEADLETVLARSRAVLAGGVRLIQLRQKGWASAVRLECARALAAECRAHGAILIINDDLPVALASGAAGVHLGQDDLPIAEARRLAGSSLLIGRSTHSVAQARAAAAEGADYIGVGPLNPTPTKAGRPAIGAATAREMARTVTIPSFVIGGIDEGNLDEAVAIGTSGVAVVRAAWAGADPEGAVRRLLAALPAREPDRAGDAGQTLAAMGEREFLRRLLPMLGKADVEVGPGDDAAVWASPAGATVATVDTFVEGFHFDLTLQAPESAGWRALALAAADVGAMGGTPRQALVSLSAPGRMSVTVAQRLMRGLVEYAASTGIAIVGGETTASVGPVTLSLTVIGELTGPALRRDRAQTGQVVLVTGPLGGPAAGLRWLREAERTAGGTAEAEWVRCFAWPRPLPGAALAAAGVAVAGDISDGLEAECARIAAASACAIEIDANAIPLSPGMEERWGAAAALQMALGGGEEEHLVFTVAPDRLDTLLAALAGAAIHSVVVGQVKPGRGVTITGGPPGTAASRGYEHFR